MISAFAEHRSTTLVQLFGAPIFGSVSDRIGRRPVLIASIGCASIP